MTARLRLLLPGPLSAELVASMAEVGQVAERLVPETDFLAEWTGIPKKQPVEKIPREAYAAPRPGLGAALELQQLH